MNAKQLHFWTAVALVAVVWGVMHYDGTKYTWICRVKDKEVCDENVWIYLHNGAMQFHPCHEEPRTWANCSIDFALLAIPLSFLVLHMRPWNQPAHQTSKNSV
jgi:hypothetical protein